ncbi:LamG-like jellyroll fold domain-containing protein [Corynebacterium frankenforstense]
MRNLGSTVGAAGGDALRRALTGSLRGDPRAVVGVVVAAVLIAVAVLGVAGRPTMGAFTAEVENAENSASYPDLQNCLEHFTNIGLKGGGAYYIAATKRGNGDNWIDDLSYPQGIDQFREDNPYLPAGTVLRPRTAGIYNHLNKVRTAPPGDEPCPADMDYPGSQWDHEGAILNKEFHSLNNFRGIGSYTSLMWIKTDEAPSALFTVPGAGTVNWDGWPTSRIYASAHIFPDGTLAFGASASRTGDNHNTPVHPLRAVAHGTTDITDNKWHQVAFVLDRDPVDASGNTIAGSQLRIYVDGKLDGETTVSYSFPQRNANFRFGCDAAQWGGVGGDLGGDQCFTGRMGLIAAYPFAVTAEDLQGTFRRDMDPGAFPGADVPEASGPRNRVSP